MDKTFTITLRTLTPIWTGGVDGSMDRIHETGILGSLRWWYEAIVRGLGGSACDPTGDNRCPDKDGRYCDVCQVFGAAGLQRAFRLEGDIWINPDRGRKLVVKMRNHQGWHLGRGFLGKTDLHLVLLRTPSGMTLEELQQIFGLLFRLIECWGGLGSKTQQGYGVIRIDAQNGITFPEGFIEKLPSIWEQSSRRRVVRRLSMWPSLDEFFFVKVRFLKDDHSAWLKNRINNIKDNDELEWYLDETTDEQRGQILPIAPIVRYHLRFLIKQAHKSDGKYMFTHADCHHLMGKLGRKSLIHVSHAYHPNKDQNFWEFRIWGWLPEKLSGDITRQDVLNQLRQWLGIQNGQERQWHPAKTNNKTLWAKDNLNISPSQYWFEKEYEENNKAYLRALVQKYL